MQTEITQCEDCPFNVPGGEYSGYCNHPCAPLEPKPPEDWMSYPNEQKIIHHDLGVKEEDMPKTDKTDWGRYHFETNAIPKWCPLRALESINIGVEMKINLDKQLFEENFEK